MKATYEFKLVRRFCTSRLLHHKCRTVIKIKVITSFLKIKQKDKKFMLHLLDVTVFLDAFVTKPHPDVIKFFRLNSTEHDFFLLINVKMPSTVGILTVDGILIVMRGKIAFYAYLSQKKQVNFLIYLYTYERSKFHAQLS